MTRFRLIVLLLSTFFLYFAYSWYKVPEQKLFKWLTYSSLYYDKNDKLLRFSLAEDDRYRLWIPYKKIPQELVKASILYEDKYFYSHPGVNFPAIYRAFVSTYFTGDRRVGASTITMQVAKVAFSLKSKTVVGKVKQIFYALWIEQHYSKKDILEFYFNVVSYGGNIEGIEAAAQVYFHKTALEMSLPEILSLVVVPQNPTKRNPKLKEGYKNLVLARQRLYKKYKKEYITDAQDIKRQDLWMQLPLNIFKTSQLPFISPHFITYLQKKYPYKNSIIKTTLDAQKQKLVEKEITSWIKENSTKGISNAAAVLINTKTMGVEAWAGSADFFNDKILGQVDAITSKRSPGSSLKPFVYALAMDQGLIHPMSLLKDAPYRFGAYTPENYDKMFLGPITATKALIASRNVPAVRLSSRLQKPNLYEFLKNTDITKMLDSSHYGMAIALGGMEVTMLELARLYAMLNNDGEFKKVRVLQEQKQELKTESFLSAEASWLTLDMLKQNPVPHEKKFIGINKKREVYAWKTGTSYAFRDAWTSGLSENYALIVWVGNFDGKGNPNFIGREAASPLFFKIMKALDAKSALADKLIPKDYYLNLALVDICEATGTLPSKLCPSIKKSWFIPGVSPIKESNIFRQISINIKSGKRACFYEKGKTELRTYEFWPSDLLEIFEMAGVKKVQPPVFESSCANLSNKGLAPKIQSPSDKLIYTLELDKIEESIIPFKAILDADSHKAFWFVNNAFVGTSKASKPLFWKAQLGEFRVKVVDENGLSSTRKITVEVAH